MNVFVLCTGRCGSTTFARACGHMTNYTSAHESRRRPEMPLRTRQDVRYPGNHIEVDNRLSWFLGALDHEYGGDAFYVHLLRDREEVAASFLNRWEKRQTNIMFAFAWGMLTYPYDQVTQLSQDQRLEIARVYWDTVNANIRAFLRDKPRQMTVWLHEIKDSFPQLWNHIGATGDLPAAMRTWDTAYNASAPADQRRREKAPGSEVFQGIPCEKWRREDPLPCESATFHDPAGAGTGAAGATSQAVARAVQSFQKRDLERICPRPEPKGWMMDAETLAFLVRVIELLEPTHVVEFGSGLSTRVVAWASARLPHPCHVTSIDHDPEFINQTRADVAEGVPGASVTCVSAPLVARTIADRRMPAYHYSRETVLAHGTADLIVIDGPPRALGGRAGALYQALDVARAGTLVLVHDAARQEESDAIAACQKELEGAIQVTFLPGFPKGLAAIVVIRPVRLDEVGLHRTRLTVEDLRQFVGPGSTTIVIDDGTLPEETVAQLSAKRFLERNGEYWGCPASDEEAIEELERLRTSGARYLAFVAASFWWLTYYAGLQRHIDSRFTCVLRNERVIVFDLEANGAL